ncbi:hypothetical protein ACWC9T_21470 [Kitasatospora sp. NPDC001159]
MTSDKPTYEPARDARDLEEAAATESGEQRLYYLGQAALCWSDDDNHARALELLSEVTAARHEYPDQNWVLPLHAYELFTVGRADEAWAVVEAAEKHIRSAGGSYDHEQLAGYLADAGHLDRALDHYTAALELLLGGDDRPDRNPARRRSAQEASPVPRIRTARRQIREQLGLPEDALDRTPDPVAPQRPSFAARWRLRRRR